MDKQGWGKPRTECCCQSVTVMIAAIVAPVGIRSIAMTVDAGVDGVRPRAHRSDGRRAHRLCRNRLACDGTAQLAGLVGGVAAIHGFRRHRRGADLVSEQTDKGRLYRIKDGKASPAAADRAKQAA